MKLSAVADPNRSSEPTFARSNNPERRIPRRTSGCCTVCSTATNTEISTAETASAPSVRGGVEAERPVPPVTFTERGREDRERRRCCEGRGHPLDEANGDQQRSIGGDRAEARRGDERDQAPDEHALAPEHVGAPSPEQEEPAVAEDERRDDPLQLAVRQVQRGADRRQRDLDE